VQEFKQLVTAFTAGVIVLALASGMIGREAGPPDAGKSTSTGASAAAAAPKFEAMTSVTWLTPDQVKAELHLTGDQEHLWDRLEALKNPARDPSARTAADTMASLQQTAIDQLAPLERLDAAWAAFLAALNERQRALLSKLPVVPAP
jgi:hypothetical protein